MTTRQSLLTMTAAAGFIALPAFAFAQAGSSTTGATSTTPQASQAAPGSHSSTTAQNRDASGGVMAQGHNTSNPPDGTPGNPPSTATQRAADSVTGNRTPPDGTPGNPPGTAAGRAADRALGTNMSGAHPENENNRTGTSTTTGANTTTTTTTSTTGATSPTMAVDSNALRNNRRASKVIGSTVYNENNESIGEVDDLLISRDGTGQPVAVISVGGFLGIGSRLVAVPYDRLQMNAQNNRWTLPGATKDSLNSLPPFAYDNTNANKG